MVKRSAIGASAATAVIFSVLLISNMTVFMAAQGRQRLYIQAGAEDSLSKDAQVLAAVGAVGLLGSTQYFLGGASFNCATATEDTANQLASLYDIQRRNGLTVMSTASWAPSVSVYDNMSMVKPFDGSVAGFVDILVKITASGASLSSGVFLERSEFHLVHLPVRLVAAVSVCTTAVDVLKSSLEGSRPSNCTGSAIGPIMSRAIAGLSSMVASGGFGMSIKYAVVYSGGCFVYFDVNISQDGVEGPLGLFSLRVQEADFAYVRLTAPLPA